MTALPTQPCARYRLSTDPGPSGAGCALSAALPAAVAEALAVCLPGWRVCAEDEVPARPAIQVEAAGPGYLVRHVLLPGGCFEAATPPEAANAVAGAATGAWIAARRDWVQLHAAAVELGGRLTLLLGASGAGKSTLALECAAAGHRLFGDDRLALELPEAGASSGRVQGIALGVGAKLRRPLPAGTSPALRRLAVDCAVGGTGAVDFLTLPEASLARPGARAPVERLVLLTRSPDARPALTGLEPAAALRALLPNALAPHLGPGALLAWSQALVARLPCRRLGYREAAEARDLLEAAPCLP
ncbi:MAG: hypothetical protein WD341_00175 [Tistlia sp.]|uniref:hypothetical protein n=1 Tax=Tistlia sp. TaxID=3057121 RepID=UPI0034A55177